MIVDVALRLLNKQGLRAVTMREIAGRLGVGVMTLYTYFPNRAAIRDALHRRGFAMLHASCERASDGDEPLSWRRSARQYVEFARSNPRLYELMFTTPVAGRDAEQSYALLAEQFEPFQSRVREKLSAAGDGEAVEEADARRAAVRYWVALHGLASLVASGRQIPADVDKLLGDIVERMAPTHAITPASD